MFTVDSKGRDTQDRSVYLYEFGFESTCLFSYHHSSSDREVTVQPGMPYAPAISFYADLEITRLGAFRDRTNSKIRAVHMGRNDTDSGALLPLRRKCKGYEGSLIPSKIIFPTRLDILFPLIFLPDLLKASFLKSKSSIVHCVEGGWGSVDELEKTDSSFWARWITREA